MCVAVPDLIPRRTDTFSPPSFHPRRITVIINIVTTVMIYVPGISAVYHSILVIPNVLLTSIMACRVYRNTRLIVHHSPELSIPTLNDRNLNIPLSVGHFSPGSGMTGSLGRSEGDLANPEFTGSKRGASKSIPSFQPETAVP
jgi:hypothetical protein